MTAQPQLRREDPIVADPERTLDAYADATRINASAALVRRFQAEVARERAADRGPRARVRGWLSRAPIARSLPVRTHLAAGAGTALRLQGLALLLLLILALGLVAGGAGAAILRVLDGPTHGPIRGSRAPVELVAPTPSPVTRPTPAPTVRVRPLAQQAPARHRATHRTGTPQRRHRRADGKAAVRLAPACSVRGASGAPVLARPHATRRACAF